MGKSMKGITIGSRVPDIRNNMMTIRVIQPIIIKLKKFCSLKTYISSPLRGLDALLHQETEAQSVVKVGEKFGVHIMEVNWNRT